MTRKQKKKRKSKSRFRRTATLGGIVFLVLFTLYAALATWFVHHPRPWVNEKWSTWPQFIVSSLCSLGNPIGDVTDALGWTGHDVVYTYDTDPPAGDVAFAGLPQRVAAPAPDDIQVLDRGDFKIGWSPKLHHPVWCAYHVVAEAKYPTCRKNFHRDASVASAPRPDDYKGSGYDRGHMAPNYAIVTRYGEDAQRRTFLMSNIAPQTSSLNSGVWRDIEHRVAEFWTARYGEIWVIVGCIPSASQQTFGRLQIDVPDAFFQVIVAQEGLDVRALAVLFPQRISYYAYASRYLITIDELEELTGLDFLPELPEFIQAPLEAELPTRLWPIRARDIFRWMNLFGGS